MAAYMKLLFSISVASCVCQSKSRKTKTKKMGIDALYYEVIPIAVDISSSFVVV